MTGSVPAPETFTSIPDSFETVLRTRDRDGDRADRPMEVVFVPRLEGQARRPDLLAGDIECPFESGIAADARHIRIPERPGQMVLGTGVGDGEAGAVRAEENHLHAVEQRSDACIELAMDDTGPFVDEQRAVRFENGPIRFDMSARAALVVMVKVMLMADDLAQIPVAG